MSSPQDAPGQREPNGQPWGSAEEPALPPWGSPPAPSTPYPSMAYPSAPYPSPPPSGPYPSAPYTAASGPVDQNARNWATGAHLSGFVAAWFALGFLGPLVVLLTVGNTSPFVRRHAVEALNFNLTVLIAIGVSVVLMLALVGFLLLPLVGLLYLVSTIRGAIAASGGQEFRYPMTIRFIR